MTVDLSVVSAAPDSVAAVVHLVGTSGAVPRRLGMSRRTLSESGFTGKAGQSLVLPAPAGPAQIVVGTGDPVSLDAATLRTAAATAVRAAGPRTSLAIQLGELGAVDPSLAGAAVAEGIELAAYRYQRYKSTAQDVLASAVLVTTAGRRAAVAQGVRRGHALARATTLARDLGNTPAADLPARVFAERAAELAAGCGLEVEILDEVALAELGCGGMLGVNRGSAEPPRVVKLRYRPSGSARSRGHLAMVGKGVMFDSGGLSLKPSDGMVWMKLDMSGAAAVLAAMSVLGELGCSAEVSGWLMCTDNMSGGDAMRLGDVLTFRNGKTAEIHNTDAEGRLVLADGLALAAEAGPDAVVDIATLTGACVVALGKGMAGVLSNDDVLATQVEAAAQSTGEQVWRLPLEPSYRKLLDSYIADMKNVGGPHGGTIVAGLFLQEFVGDLPWAHVDIAGPMQADADDGWTSRGATGYGARLLAELACGFTPPRRSTRR